MVGKHLIVDLKFSDHNLLVHGGNFLSEMLSACVDAQAHVLESYYHDFGENHGYTFIIALAESHVSCHTWPEFNLACIDMFTCGKVHPELVLHHFIENIKDEPEILKKTNLDRGSYNAPAYSNNSISTW